MFLEEAERQERGSVENDEDRHFFPVRHVHLPQSRNDDQQNGQIGGDIEHSLNNFVVKVRGTFLLRRRDGKISRERATVEEECELDGDVSCQGVSCAELDPELS